MRRQTISTGLSREVRTVKYGVLRTPVKRKPRESARDRGRPGFFFVRDWCGREGFDRSPTVETIRGISGDLWWRPLCVAQKRRYKIVIFLLKYLSLSFAGTFRAISFNRFYATNIPAVRRSRSGVITGYQ